MGDKIQKISMGEAVALRRLPNLKSLVPCFFGFAFTRAWNDAAFDMFATIVPGRAWLGKDFFLLAMIGAFAVLAVIARHVAPLYEKRGVYAGAMALPCVAMVSFCMGTCMTLPPVRGILLGISLVVGGVGATLSILLWAELQSCFNSFRLVLYMSGSFFFGALLGWVVTGLEGPRFVLAMFALPLMSVWCLKSGFARIPRADLPKRMWGKMRFPWSLVAVLGIYQFVYSVASRGPIASVSSAVWGTVIASALLFFLAYLFSHKFDITLVYRTPFVLMTCGLLTMLLSFSSGVVGALCVSAAWAFMFLVLTVLLCDISHRYGISVLVLCGIQEVSTITIPLGDCVHAAMQEGILPVRPDDAASIGVLAILVAVATAILFFERKASVEWSLAFFGADEAAKEDARFVARCTEIGGKFGLSPREREVFLLIVSGRSSAEIESGLCIANGTLKSHTRRIYQKLGVHSRQELLGLIDVPESGDEGAHDIGDCV